MGVRIIIIIIIMIAIVVIEKVEIVSLVPVLDVKPLCTKSPPEWKIMEKLSYILVV